MKTCIRLELTPRHLEFISNRTPKFTNHINDNRASNYIRGFQSKILKLELNECYRCIYLSQRILKATLIRLNKEVPYNILCKFLCSQQRAMHLFYVKKRSNLNNKIGILKLKKFKNIKPITYYTTRTRDNAKINVINSHRQTTFHDDFVFNFDDQHSPNSSKINIQPE